MTNTKELSWSPSAPQQRALEGTDVFSQRPRYIHPAAIHASFPAPGYGYRDKGNSESFKTLGKLSFLSIGFGLMLLGACFFGSGFWMGCWVSGKNGATATASLASLSTAPTGSLLSPSHANALLEIIGASGGNTGRIAEAAQRSLEANQQGAYTEETALTPSAATMPNSLASGLATRSPGAFFTSSPSPAMRPGENRLSPPAQTLYSVQLGAYATKANAADLMHQLQELAIPTFLVEGKSAEGTPVFYVRAGAYHPFELAEAAARSIAEQSNLTAVVVTPGPGEKRLSQ
jgi:cell division septation protein DedD